MEIDRFEFAKKYAYYWEMLTMHSNVIEITDIPIECLDKTLCAKAIKKKGFENVIEHVPEELKEEITLEYGPILKSLMEIFADLIGVSTDEIIKVEFKNAAESISLNNLINLRDSHGFDIRDDVLNVHIYPLQPVVFLKDRCYVFTECDPCKIEIKFPAK